ncbi:MAG: hypothetical protein WEC34_01045 [Acidimicrobiia bacterium]
MTDVQRRNREVLDAVRVRRDSLYDAVLELEGVLATPAGDDPGAWAAAVTRAVVGLQAVLARHVAETEGDGGFFEEVRDQAPQLLSKVERLEAEHGLLVQSTASLATRLTAVTNDADVDEVREAALDLIQRLLRHRHRGAELVYDAYAIDISAAD